MYSCNNAFKSCLRDAREPIPEGGRLILVGPLRFADHCDPALRYQLLFGVAYHQMKLSMELEEGNGARPRASNTRTAAGRI